MRPSPPVLSPTIVLPAVWRPTLLARAALPLAALLFATALSARDRQAAGPGADAAAGDDGDVIGIGLGVGSVPDYEGSSHNLLTPVPGAAGRIDGIEFLLVGNRVSADLVPLPAGARWDIELGPVASLGFNRTSPERIDDPRIRALGKVGVAVELGGYVGIGRVGVITSAYDRLSLSVSYRHDVAGAYDGATYSPTLSYMTPLSTKVATTFFLAAEHADSHYAARYFSITPAQSTASGLPVFAARAGWKDWSTGAAVGIALKGDLRHGLLLLGGVGYQRLLGDFAASPVTSIAGSRDQWLLGTGLAYTF